MLLENRLDLRLRVLRTRDDEHEAAAACAAQAHGGNPRRHSRDDQLDERICASGVERLLGKPVVVDSRAERIPVARLDGLERALRVALQPAHDRTRDVVGILREEREDAAEDVPGHALAAGEVEKRAVPEKLRERLLRARRDARHARILAFAGLCHDKVRAGNEAADLVLPAAAGRHLPFKREGERRDALPFRPAARDALKRSDERRAENRARAHAAALRDVGGNLDVEPAMREVELRHRERALYESAPVVRILRCADFGKRL